MLPLKKSDRVRMLSAVAYRGPKFLWTRNVVITASLLLILIVPLIGLCRVDLWRGNHFLLFEPVDSLTKALKGFVVAMGLLWGLTFITNMVVGRFFCGWGCPVGFVSRLGEDVTTKKSRTQRLLHQAKGAGFVAVFVSAVMLWWVDPRVLIDGSFQAKAVVLGIFAVLWGGGYLHAFVWRFGFCVSVCPIGLYYRYVTSHAPVGIVFSEVPSPCIQCHSCEKICPVAIDPKRLGVEMPKQFTNASDEPERYGDAECIRCGDCIEACRVVFLNRVGETPPLRFGMADESRQDPPTEKSAENRQGVVTALGSSK